MTIWETHISLTLHRHTNPILINSHIYWVKYHSVPSQQQDMWPVTKRKGQPVKNKHHCKYNPYLCLFIFPFVLYLHIIITMYIDRHMTFEMSLFCWNFCECNVYCSFFFIIYFTFFGNVNMFPMPIKPLELNWIESGWVSDQRWHSDKQMTDEQALSKMTWISFMQVAIVYGSSGSFTSHPEPPAQH